MSGVPENACQSPEPGPVGRDRGFAGARQPVAGRDVPGHEDLRFLLQDPFLIDQMSYERPTSLSGEILPKS
jgi:hypothetical protein